MTLFVDTRLPRVIFRLMEVKFPDYCDYGAVPSPSNARFFGARWDRSLLGMLQPQCARSYFFVSTIIVLWVTIAVCLIALSLAAMKRYYHEATDAVVVEAIEKKHTLKRTLSNSASQRNAPVLASPPRSVAPFGQTDADLLKLLTTMRDTLEALSRQVATRS